MSNENKLSIDEFIERGANMLPDELMSIVRNDVAKQFLLAQDIKNGKTIDTFGIDTKVAVLLAITLEEFYFDKPEEVLEILLTFVQNRKIKTEEIAPLGTLTNRGYSAVFYFTNRVLELAFNDWRVHNSKEANAFLKDLLNRFYKKDVKRICKYHEINRNVIQNDLIDQPSEEIVIRTPDYDTWLAFCIVVAQLYGIPLENTAYSIVTMANNDVQRARDRDLEDDDKYTKKLKSIQEKSEQLVNDKIIPDAWDYELSPNKKRLFNTLIQDYGYTDGILKTTNRLINGADYPYVFSDSMLMAGRKPEAMESREIDNECFYINTASEFLHEIGEYQSIISSLLGFKLLYEISEESQNKEETHIKEIIEKTETETHNESEDALIEELRHYQAMTRSLQEKINSLKEIIEKKKLESRNNHLINEEAERLRAEVIALRKFAYESAEDSQKEPEISIEEKIKYLKEKTVAIIGGHETWFSKLRLKFPDWKYITPSVSGTIPVEAIDSADKVYFFTTHICHSQYNKYLDYLRLKRKPVGYIARVNIADNINQIYNDFFENQE